MMAACAGTCCQATPGRIFMRGVLLSDARRAFGDFFNITSPFVSARSTGDLSLETFAVPVKEMAKECICFLLLCGNYFRKISFSIIWSQRCNDLVYGTFWNLLLKFHVVLPSIISLLHKFPTRIFITARIWCKRLYSKRLMDFCASFQVELHGTIQSLAVCENATFNGRALSLRAKLQSTHSASIFMLATAMIRMHARTGRTQLVMEL
jgi:hypothetical protein